MTTSNVAAPTPWPRLQLSPQPRAGSLDGAWRPQSHDLERELADLLDHFPGEAGHISRAIFSRPDWSTSPRRVKVTRGYLKTGSFPHDDSHVMLLKLSNGRQLTLLVIPPETPEPAARALMARAASAANQRTGAELISGSDDPLRADA